VAGVKRTLVHGTPEDLARALDASSSSSKVNTAFVERQNGTDRGLNARKARKTYEFSKDLLVHFAVSWWVIVCYNFHHIHRGLRLLQPDGSYINRTPAMAIGLAVQPLTVTEIHATQLVGFEPRARPVFRGGVSHARTGPAP
jgi:hypothetical protein